MSPTIQLGVLAVDEHRLVEICQRHKVRELLVFGSAARGEMRPESDVDLIVEFQPGANVDLIDHASLMLDLQAFLGRRVDLVSKRALKPRIREAILNEARPVYAA